MPPPRFSPAEHALVWAIRSAFPLNGAAAVSAPEADVDWLEVARQARKHALEPLLHAAVAKLAIRQAIPAEVLETLRTAYQRTSRANLASYAELGRLLGEFQREQIPAILLKGGALAAALYPAIGLRPMRDLDILVSLADVERASAVLLARGYAAVAERAQRRGESVDCERAFMPARGESLPVELHWHIINVFHFRRRTPVSWFWRQSVDTPFCGLRALVLTPEAQLIHLATHLKLNHHGDRWLREYDIALLLARLGGRIRWEEVTTAARGFQLSLVLAAALDRVERVWGVAAPASARDELWRLPGIGQRLACAMTSPRLRGFQPLWNALAAPGWAHKLAFLREYAFPSLGYMRRRYGLSRPHLAPLYYLRHLGQGFAKIVRPDSRG
jgi:hypothetical protein